MPQLSHLHTSCSCDEAVEGLLESDLVLLSRSLVEEVDEAGLTADMGEIGDEREGEARKVSVVLESSLGVVAAEVGGERPEVLIPWPISESEAARLGALIKLDLGERLRSSDADGEGINWGKAAISTSFCCREPD